MPRIPMNPEYGDALRHTFKVMTPEASIKAGGNKVLPNACSSCHYHKNMPLETLAGFLEAARKRDIPVPFSVHRHPPAQNTEVDEKGGS